MAWMNIGDLDPKQGTTVVTDMELDDGDFTARAVEIIPETHVGGSDRVFLIKSGEMFLSAKNIASALETVGARLSEGVIYRDNSDAVPLDSEQGLLELANAANAFGGIEDHDAPLAGIGLPRNYDGDPKFDGEMTLFTSTTTLWSVLRAWVDGFDYAPEDDPVEAVELDTWTGPYAGMPRNVSTRADLAQIEGFKHLERDEHGNPKVFLNTYVHEGCDEAQALEGGGGDTDIPEWTKRSTCEEEGDCYECGEDIDPISTVWIGPDEADLKELWQSLPDCEENEVEDTPEPGF
jgi:hypothetical protein